MNTNIAYSDCSMFDENSSIKPDNIPHLENCWVSAVPMNEDIWRLVFERLDAIDFFSCARSCKQFLWIWEPMRYRAFLPLNSENGSKFFIKHPELQHVECSTFGTSTTAMCQSLMFRTNLVDLSITSSYPERILLMMCQTVLWNNKALRSFHVGFVASRTVRDWDLVDFLSVDNQLEHLTLPSIGPNFIEKLARLKSLKVTFGLFPIELERASPQLKSVSCKILEHFDPSQKWLVSVENLTIGSVPPARLHDFCQLIARSSRLHNIVITELVCAFGISDSAFQFAISIIAHDVLEMLLKYAQVRPIFVWLPPAGLQIRIPRRGVSMGRITGHVIQPIKSGLPFLP